MTELNKKFSTKIIFILSLWAFSLLCIVFFNKYIDKKIDDQILGLIKSLSVESSININSTIENKFTVLETISKNISTEDLNNPQEMIKSFSDTVEDNNLKRLAITTPDGIAYCDNGEIVDVSDRDYFKAAMDGNRFISSIANSRFHGRRCNVFSIPVFRNGEVVAILWECVLTDEFYEELNLDIMSGLGDTFVVDSKGDIIVSDQKLTSASDNFNLYDIFNCEAVKATETELKNENKGKAKLKYDNGNNIMYYAKLDYSNWWVVSLISDDSVKYYSYTTMRSITIFNVIMILLISVAIIIIFNKEKTSYKKLKAVAYKDTITEGKNDIFLKHNISKFINKEDNFAFISLEIVNIKNIVTIIGLKNTEFLLKEIYVYLQNLLDKEEIIVHSYFGEYKLLMKYTDIKELTQRFNNIDFSKINGNIKFIIGIYLLDEPSISYEEMCSYVSIAKETFNNNNTDNSKIYNNKYMVYNETMHKREIDKVRLEEDIKNGIKNKEFKAWYQPKYGKDGKTIVGAEALVRWYKYGSIISPHIFVPMCEGNGLIKEIDELVFEDVCKNIRSWIDNNRNVVPVCINLSRSYLNEVNFIDKLEKYIDKYKVPKELFHFEITESSLVGNEENLKDMVSILHEKGFLVSVDDFGVGYSSIKAISYVDFDALKIDKSFIDGIGEQKWENIIKYTINLANSLDMDVVAEGIETEEQYKFLLECNCDMFQGYYFNKPMDSEDFSKLI